LRVQSSAKKIWYNSDGLSTSVETPQTAHARQLQELYNILLNDLFDQDERIDVLMTIKNTVKVFHLPLDQSNNTIQIEFLVRRLQ